MNESNLHTYQKHSVDHIIKHPASGLFLGMGMGKSVSTLTAINRLMFEEMEVSRVLVIAPLKVAESVWTDEVAKWDHLKHLKISRVLGSEAQRIAALRVKADIYIINRENVVWLVGFYGTSFPFDMLVIDELSSFKSAKAARFKALRRIRPKINRVVGLTGTPAPNSLLDLWPQMYLLDQGQRLGETLTGYREKYFNKNPHKPFDKYKVREESDDLIGEGFYEKKIYEKIADICISMKAEDYLELPERIDRDIVIHLPPRIQDQYLEFEKKQILALEDIENITAFNAGALTNKLLQFCNGAVYDANKIYHEVHKEKLDRLEEILDTANGPVLTFYSYQHDLDRIMRHLKRFKPQHLKKADQIVSWNKGHIPLLLAHPASAGHGLNMQAGGNHMVWFGPTWSSELYLQAIARLLRQGQVNNVIVNRLLCIDTMDMDVVDVLSGKIKGQDALLRALKFRAEKYFKKAA